MHHQPSSQRKASAIVAALSFVVLLSLALVPVSAGANQRAHAQKSAQRLTSSLCSYFYTNVEVAPVTPSGAGLARGYPIDCVSNATGQLTLSGSSSVNGSYSALYTCNFTAPANQGPTIFCPNGYPGGHCAGLSVRAFMWANVGGTVISYTSGPLKCT